MYRWMRVTAVGVVCLGVSLAAFSSLGSQAEARSALVDVLAARVTVAQGGAPIEIVGERVVGRGDRIRTDASGQGLITYRDGSTVLLDANSELVIELIETDDRGVFVRMTQTLGRAWYSLSRLSLDSRFEVQSAAMASVIRAGSDSYVVVGPDGETTVVVTEGTVETAGAGVTVTVAAGSATSVAVGSSPSSPAPAPSPLPRPTPVPTATPTPSATPTATPTATATASPSPTPAPTPAATAWLGPATTPQPIPSTAFSAPPSPSGTPLPALPGSPRPLPGATAQPTATIPPIVTVPVPPTLP